MYSGKNYFVSQELTYYRRNCSRLVPDSGNNFCHYFALLSIEHFFCACRVTVGFFF